MPVKSASLQEIDHAHHLHPFTDHAELHAQGTHVLVSGRGVCVTDQEGRRLIDGLAGLWCVNVGYDCRRIIEAVTDQMSRLPYYPSFFNSTTEPAILLAERLAWLAPPRLNHSIFSNSGSEANETALKLIRAYHKLRGQPQRTKILTRTFSYHGVTLATTSMTGLPSCTEPFDLPLPGFVRVPGPHAYAADPPQAPEAYGDWCLDETRRTIEREGPETIAALFAEPVQGAGGVIVPPPGHVKRLRDLCREFDVLFVADEVISGFGRLGAWFGSTLWDLDPDFMTLAKGLTSGYLPMGATMVSDEIAATLKSAGYLAHGFTYSGHPSCAAAALANLDVIEADGLIDRVRDRVGPYLQQWLQEFREHPAVGDVRGFGLLGALELVPKGGRSALRPGLNLGVHAAKLVRQKGAIVRGIRDIVALAPPFIIDEEQIDELMQAIRRGLDAYWHLQNS